MISQPFQWIFTGIDLSIKLLWILVFPLRLIMWCSNLIINFIILGIIILIICIFTGNIPDSYITTTMDTVGHKIVHYIDPNGDKNIKIPQKLITPKTNTSLN